MNILEDFKKYITILEFLTEIVKEVYRFRKEGMIFVNMARVLKNKELVNMRLATNYGGWMYCDNCNENIGYLCYSTYDKLELKFKCNCGSKGSALLDFEDSKVGKKCSNDLIIIKNRFCCPNDNEPLITILDKKVANYELNITCKSCENIYKKEK